MGRGTAECFARDGARVAILGRTQADLDATLEHLREIGSPDVFGIQADIVRLDQVEQGFAQVGERFGALNILVNAAGPDMLGGLETLTDEEWFAAIDMGAMGTARGRLE
jgi:NAD(P)-dependent dehydrogenase (short-subunit alcohol dehydrogenase family)